MASVTFEGASRLYPRSTSKAVDELSLDVRDGELLVLVGPSGCGKTTSLRMLAGLEPVDEGDILVDDRSVVKVAPQKRNIAMVFQNSALYPHMTVAKNLAFALEIAKLSKAEISARVSDTAKMLGLEKHLDRRPGQLSGGQRQRVAMGRAIVRQPRVFLLDEPLSNLDAQLRIAMRAEIGSVQRRLGVTAIYVTHDQVEAMTMGDRVAVLKDGVLQQVDPPSDLYDSPANAFVAGFIGLPAMNLVRGTIGEDGVTIGATVVQVPRGLKGAAGTGKVTVGLRPDALALVAEGPGIPAAVNLVEELGADAYVYAQLEHNDAETPDVAVRVARRSAPKAGARVIVQVKDVDSMLLFDARTGVRITED